MTETSACGKNRDILGFPVNAPLWGRDAVFYCSYFDNKSVFRMHVSSADCMRVVSQDGALCRYYELLREWRVRKLQEEFAVERNWNQYHTPRNLLLALVGEVGELAEIFQWKGEVKEGLPDFTEEERKHVGQEMSDVLVYLVRLADKCQIDLSAAVLEKIRLNAEKYPVHKVYGKSDKYTEYRNDVIEMDAEDRIPA